VEALCAAETEVQVVTRRLETVTGLLTSWTPDRLVIRGETLQSIAAADLWTIRFPEQRVRVVEGDWVILSNGDRLAASARQTRDDRVEAAWTSAPLRPHWIGPLETVSALVFGFPSAPRIRRDWLAAIEHVPAGADVVQFIAGERLQGEFEQLEGQQVVVAAAFGATQLDRQRIRWIRFDRDLQTVPKLPDSYWLVWLTDGSRLTAARLEPGENQEVQLSLLVGGSFAVPLHRVSRLQRFDAQWQPLSQREPANTMYTPYLSGQHALRRNQNVLGSPLVVRGTEFGVGLGMTSAMTATYRIEPNDLEFRAQVGIDDASDGRGSARFRVLVDDRLAWESEELTGRMPLVSMPPVMLSGAKLLTLQVDYGHGGDVADFADWCDAVIVRAAGQR
jgi:hypothetical protein